MSRKVKTPKFLMRDFSLNLWFILSVVIILMIVFSGAKEIDSTVYKGNHFVAVASLDIRLHWSSWLTC